MNSSGNSSGTGRILAILGGGGLLAIIAVMLAVPGAVESTLGLWDRVTGHGSASTSSATQVAAPSSPRVTFPPNEPPTDANTWSPPSPENPSPQQPSTDSPSNAQPQPPSTTADAPPSIPVVDRIQISTWAYDKTALNTYRADNAGGKSIRVSWTASSNGHEVNGACASSVRIEGPDTDQAKDASNCSDSMGTYFDVHQPGTYRVTVTTHQDSGAEHSDNISVTIVP